MARSRAKPLTGWTDKPVPMVWSVVTGVGIVAIVVGIGLFAWHRVRTRDRRALAAALEDALADAMAPGTGSHLERAPSVRRIAVVGSRSGAGSAGDGEGEGDGENESGRANETETASASEDIADRPVYVPIVRVDLETTDAPGMKLILEYVADVLEAIHPVCMDREAAVAHYDVEFTFGPDGLFVDGECKRVSVAPDLADRLLEDDRYGAFELWRDVKRANRDDETPTTLWGECRNYSRRGPDQK